MSYPIGAVYISVNPINPKEFFGGEWEQIKDRFLLSCGETYVAGQIGGEASHVLQDYEIPKHKHQIDLSETSDLTAGLRGVCTWQSGGATGRLNVAKELDASGTGVGERHWTTLSFNFNHGHNVTCQDFGLGMSHNNMPPYLAVYMWKRIK